MAKFTFGAGNAKKLLRLPLYALGSLASRLARRHNRLWVMGSGIGLGEGALPLYRAAREHLGASRRIIWLASTDDELAAARALGLDAALKSSWRGFRLTLRARVLVVTHGFGDVNRYGVRGGFVVQLWHGVPLKRLHLDSPATMRVSFLPDHRLIRGLLARAYRSAGASISLFPVASRRIAPRIVSAFGLPADRVVITGDVRDDVLLRGDADERRATARQLIEGAVGPIDADSRVVLYAPTWRDGAPDPSIPSDDEWAGIARWLDAHDAVMLVRSHPLGRGSYDEGARRTPRVRLLGSEVLADVTPVLPAVDTLVTDYSSIAYDFALTGHPIVFFAPDVERYAKSRGLYESYRAFSGARNAETWAGVLAWLEEPADERATAQSRRLAAENFDLLDGRAAERVLAEVLRRTGQSVPQSLDAAAGLAVERPVVDTADADVDAAVLRIRLSGAPAGATLTLDGGRARVAGAVTADGDGLVVQFPLLSSRWGSDGLALPSGSYRLVIDGGAHATDRVQVSTEPLDARHPLFRLTTSDEAGGFVVTVAAPLADDERGPAAQKRLEREYRAAADEPLEAVFFESFYGRTVACNPLGIDRVLAAEHPDIVRYWSVVDASVAVPEGAVRVIEGSRAWWEARRRARVLVVNDWLRKRWKKRGYQTVLQTWHGTMLKRLALDRGGRDLRTRIAVLRERDRWDVLLAQNAYSASIFRSAYAFRGPIWEEGYPRNDVIVEADAAALRERLGIPAGARVVLYAPTWRDDRTEMVDYLDLENFAGRLDANTVLLARGHSRTLPFGRDLRGAGLIDVTSYPSMADLLTVSDILVTDYSSVMFDWAMTGRPYVFFTPDLAHYSADLRGFYFDLLAEAPGPVVATRAELLDVLALPDAGAAAHAERRAEWAARFAPHDDGSAGSRVVQRMRDEGMLG